MPRCVALAFHKHACDHGVALLLHFFLRNIFHARNIRAVLKVGINVIRSSKKIIRLGEKNLEIFSVFAWFFKRSRFRWFFFSFFVHSLHTRTFFKFIFISTYLTFFTHLGHPVWLYLFISSWPRRKSFYAKYIAQNSPGAEFYHSGSMTLESNVQFNKPNVQQSRKNWALFKNRHSNLLFTLSIFIFRHEIIISL